MIYISKGNDHTTGLVEQHLQHLALYHLTERAYQLPTMIFSETDLKLYYAQCGLAIVDNPSHSICLLFEIKSHSQIYYQK